MAKVTLNDITNLANTTSAQSTINNNNDTIETAFDNTLSRDGTSPNSMSADLDMNSQRILNLPAPTTAGEPLRKDDQFTSTEAQQFATDAETAKNDAESALATFQGIFLGSYSSDPATDPNGNAINEGDFYYDTTNNVVKFYNGSSFVVSESNSFFPNVDADVTASDEELNKLAGIGTILEGPGASSDPSLAFNTWRTPNASRVTLVTVHIRVETDGSSDGSVSFSVDESGGTTQDYEMVIVIADASFPAGTNNNTTVSFLVPSGGAYKINNLSDPNSGNLILDHREFTL